MTQVPTVVKIFGSAKQAELGTTPATCAFVLKASEREGAGWIVMR